MVANPFAEVESAQNSYANSKYVVLRFDGVRFGRYTEGLNFPEDNTFVTDMDNAAMSLAREFLAVAGYVASDEISIVLRKNDFAEKETEHMYRGNLTKLASIGAGHLSAVMSQARPDKLAVFDGRGFGLDTVEEVREYILSRVSSASKNAVGMAASVEFSHKQLMGKTTSDRLRMLAEAGVDYESLYSPGFRDGRLIFVSSKERKSTYVDRRDGTTKSIVTNRQQLMINDFNFATLNSKVN